MLRTSRPARIRYGLAQVRRYLESDWLEAVHVLFAPAVQRPLLLALVRLRNKSPELVQLDYTELWELPTLEGRAELGACVCKLPEGERALAEVSSALRARAPRPLASGLALALRVPVPPGERRELSFAYVAPSGAEPAAPLVRAWRGDVRAELLRTAQAWQQTLGPPGPGAVAGYRTRSSGGLR